jgi:flagellar capping protein FliD
MAVSSQTNSDEKTISGTVFTLKKITPESMEDIKLSIDLDLDGLVGKITEFMDEFNALLKFIDDNSKAFIKEETDEITGKKTSKREIGAFTGDSGISSLRENLKRMLTGTINEITGVDKVQIGTVQDGPDAGKPIYGPANGYSTVYSSAARIGFLTEKDGTVSVDRAKLTKALEADYEGVRKLFTANNFSNTTGFSVGRFTKDSKSGVYEIRASGTPGEAEVWYNGKKLEGISRTLDHGRDKILTTKDGLSFEIPDGWDGSPAKVTFVRGIANQISNFFETSRALTLTTSDGRIVPGYFKQSENTYQARIDAIEKRIDQLQMRVDNYNARLVKQFSALERSMGTLQSQSANMMSALSTLTMRR